MALSSEQQGKQTGVRTFRRRFSCNASGAKAHAADPEPEPVGAPEATSAADGATAAAHHDAPGSSAAHAEIGDEAMTA